MSSERHLITHLHDVLRTSRLSALYYEHRLRSITNLNLIFEIMIAVGSAGSIASWAFWKDPIGAIFWGIIAGCSTILAIVKPILTPGKRIELYTRQHQGWNALYYATEKLLLGIQEEGAFTKDTRKQFDTIFDRKVALCQEDEKYVSEKLTELCQEKTNQQLPPDRLWMPPDDVHSKPENPIVTGTKTEADEDGVVANILPA